MCSSARSLERLSQARDLRDSGELEGTQGSADRRLGRLRHLLYRKADTAGELQPESWACCFCLQGTWACLPATRRVALLQIETDPEMKI